jgi:hypothetical protein
VWLYRIWPQVIDAMVLVKPATVVQWHRKGFRLFWRWRSRRPGRPKIGTEIRDLIRRMSKANPLWGAPRIHGELLKLGIKVSQATVGRWMPWRPTVPSPTWRSFLGNHLPDIAAIDMFVVATATFRLLYALIVLSLDRRRVVHFEVMQNPTQDWLSCQMTEAFPGDTAPRYLLRDRDKSYGLAVRHRVRDPDERRAIELNATAIVLAHNHPSGDPTPSRADIGMTQEVVKVCQVLKAAGAEKVFAEKVSDTVTDRRPWRRQLLRLVPATCCSSPGLIG